MLKLSLLNLCICIRYRKKKREKRKTSRRKDSTRKEEYSLRMRETEKMGEVEEEVNVN